MGGELDMNPSERLHNQGSEQQYIAPELELSIELWDTCEKLLQERGRNRFTPTNILGLVLQPLHTIKALSTKNMPQYPMVWRVVELKKLKDDMNNKPDITITCMGTNPNNARQIALHNIRMNNVSGPYDGKRVVVLERDRKGKVLDSYLMRHHPFGSPKGQEKQLATTEELEAYKIDIKQRLPIEHK